MAKALKYLAAILIIAAIPVCLLQSADTRGGISGVVKDKDGQPVAGALVIAKNADRGIKVTVTTQDNGRYAASNLLDGKYTVQAFGAGMQSDAATVEVASSATQDLAFTGAADPHKVNSMADYASTMPEGEGKTIIIGICTDCHRNGLQEILYSRKDHDGWADTIARMHDRPYKYFRSLVISDPQRAVVIDYLTKNYSLDSPALDAQKLPKRLWKGAAANSVSTEFAVPAGAGVHDVAVDSKGIAWVGEQDHGIVGRFDSNTFAYTRIPVPPNPGEKRKPASFSFDGQDRMWMSDQDNSRLILYDTKAGTFTDFPIAAIVNNKDVDDPTDWNTLRIDKAGTLWGTNSGGNQIIHLDPATKEVTAYKIPEGEFIKNTNPYGMGIDSDGKVWFVEGRGGKLGEIDPKTGKMTMLQVPENPPRMRRAQADAEGHFWFGDFSSGKLGMVDTRTRKITEYEPPTKFSGPYAIDIDRTHNLIWFNEMEADQIASFNPRTKEFVEYPLPTVNSSVRRITLDPTRPNRIWYAGYKGDFVGYLDINN